MQSSFNKDSSSTMSPSSSSSSSFLKENTNQQHPQTTKLQATTANPTLPPRIPSVTCSAHHKGRCQFQPQRGRLRSTFCVWWCVCACAWLLCTMTTTVAAAKASPTTTASTSTSDLSPCGRDLRDWIQARCGTTTTGTSSSTLKNNKKNNNNIAIWVYQGALFDPLDGRRIANVEGLEFVHCLASATGDQKHAYQQSGGDLECAPLLSHPNATFDYAATILSRKFFCYQAPDQNKQLQSGNQNHSLLKTIRLRPNAPLRHIPTKQVIAAYDTATTFVVPSGNSNQPQQSFIAHTEWPDGQSIWGWASRNFILGQTTKAFNFSIYARQKAARKKAEQLFDLTTTTRTSTRRSSSIASNSTRTSNNNKTKKKKKQSPAALSSLSSVVASPQRAKLIEFGTGSTSGQNKFGARETYAYTNIGGGVLPSTTTTLSATASSHHHKNGGFLGLPTFYWGKSEGSAASSSTSRSSSTSTVPSVLYSRYGEGPPFFGPGRMCSLELQGRRIASPDEIPAQCKAIIDERLPPAFWKFPAPCHQGKDDDDEPLPRAFWNFGSSSITSSSSPTSSASASLPDASSGTSRRSHKAKDAATTTMEDRETLVRWFRSLGPGALPIRPDEDEGEDFWLPDYLRDRGRELWGAGKQRWHTVTQKKK